jgi:hypothetical protein
MLQLDLLRLTVCLSLKGGLKGKGELGPMKE